jgi:hypothetical protein
MDKFQVWNKQDFIKYHESNDNIKRTNEYWDNVRKGYNFIIVDNEIDKHGIKFYSVDFFNKMFV